jgi:hypothetical protein
MKLRHALILAINTSILAVLFAFSTWLYVSSKSGVEKQVGAGLTRAATITARLAELREAELSSLAQSIAVSPMLRGALGTGDAETIRDVLRSLAAKNALDVVAVVRGPKTVYSAGTGGIPAGRFLGKAALGGADGESLVVGQAPTSALLDTWSGITDVRYALRAGPASPTHNLPAADAALSAKRAGGAADILTSGENRYYARELPLLSGRFTMELYAPYAPFWESFEAQRDSLVVLGGFLFFGGSILSVGFAALIDKHAPRASGSGDGSALVAGLIEEIEKARAARTER